MILGITYYHISMYFLIYSFLGWVTEVTYQAVSKGLIVNRGFLNGPVCPIYGCGIVSVLLLVNAAGERAPSDAPALSSENDFVIFLWGMIITTLIELVGGWILNKAFHTRWWDYSKKPFNIGGYVCLEFSIIWGLAVLFIVREVQPAIADMSDSAVDHHTGWIIMGILYAMLLADFIVSVSVTAGLNKRIRQLDEARAAMRKVSDEMSRDIGGGALETTQHIQEARIQSALARADLIDRAGEKRGELQGNAEVMSTAKKAELE
jgi:uncharacterized membrane protein